MKFPLSLIAGIRGNPGDGLAGVHPGGSLAGRCESLDTLIAAARRIRSYRKPSGNSCQPRHPSQIYEGLLEGLLLFVILWVVRVRFPKAPAGLITGLFFALYAVFRIFGEHFREPDAAMVGFLTKGQFFSFFMFLFAAAFFGHAWRRKVESQESMSRSQDGLRDSSLNSQPPLIPLLGQLLRGVGHADGGRGIAADRPFEMGGHLVGSSGL